MSVDTIKTIDQSFLELARAVERYTRGGSAHDFITASEKNMDGLGRLLSMQCVQASSARYMASLGQEFARHNNELKTIFSRLAEKPSKEWIFRASTINGIIEDLRRELYWFQKFLLENGFVSKEDLNNAEKMHAAIGDGKKRGVLSKLFEKTPKGLPGFKALIKAACENPDYKPTKIFGVEGELIKLIGLSTASAIGIMAVFLQLVGQPQSMTSTPEEARIAGMVLLGFFAVLVWMMNAMRDTTLL